MSPSPLHNLSWVQMEILIFINFDQDTNSCMSWAGGTTLLLAGQKTIHKGMNTRVCGNIQTASIRYSPLAPKFNVNVIWRALAPMDEENEKNQPPNITLGNTRAETLRFGGAGVQHSACCRVWVCCPSSVSLSDVFTSCDLQTLLWKHHSACCWSQAKLRKTLACRSKCLLSSYFFFSLDLNLFPSDYLVSRSLMFHFACWWSYSKPRKTLALRKYA